MINNHSYIPNLQQKTIVSSNRKLSDFVPLDQPLIDSFRLRVRMSKVKVIDKRLTDEFVCYYPSINSMDDDLRRAQPYVKLIKGITYRFYPKSYITPKKIAEEYLVLQISAKMAKENYFKGVSKLTIKQIYDDIINFKIFKISYKDFLDGLVTDIDFCVNSYLTPSTFKLCRKAVKSSILPSKEGLVWFPKDNLGIEFNKREKANNSNPHFIFYHKGNELTTNQKTVPFYRAFLEKFKIPDLDNLFRYEFTLKNFKHVQFLQKKNIIFSSIKTLKDMLSFPVDESMDIIRCGLPFYTDVVQKVIIGGKTNLDKIMQYHIHLMLQAGVSTKLITNLDSLFESGSKALYRADKKVNSLLQDFVVANNLQNKVELNDLSMSYLSFFGFRYSDPVLGENPD